ncbi:circadian clock-controlled protein-like [Trichoplusia ni]|uniref:Circadian clock-controlled protein-like n=1 Tax=Trichoplusia ni TaxID=7111 RepID=A0A7E5W044_TRINI|nr:circadian clock-controlled protein-like [Trichoplusia ni]
MGVPFQVSFLLLALFGFVQSGVMPEQKCKLDDKKCLVSAFQKMVPVFMAGIPEADIAVLDPMEMDDVSFDIAGFQFSLKGGRLKGLKNSVIDDVDWDTKKKILSFVFHSAVSAKGHYTAGGQLLILPISGDGDSSLKLSNVKLLENLEIKAFIHYDIVKDSEGKDHIKPKKFHFDFEVKEGAHFHLSNLFNGNKELSDNLLKFINENWYQVSNEFGRPFTNVAAKAIYKNIVKYFEKVPIQDITVA